MTLLTLRALGQRAHEAELEILEQLRSQIDGISPLAAGMMLTLQSIRTVPWAQNGALGTAPVTIEQGELLLLMASLYNLPDEHYTPSAQWPHSKEAMLEATLDALGIESQQVLEVSL